MRNKKKTVLIFSSSKIEAMQEDDEPDESVGVMRTGNTIYFYTDVTVKSVLALQMALDSAAAETVVCGCDHINLFIMSNGGDLHAGFAAHDAIWGTRVWVNTIVSGCAFSAGHLLAMGGHSRYMTRHSQLLVHQISHSFQGKSAAMHDEIMNDRAATQRIVDVYVARTSMSPAEVRSMLSNERHVFVEEAKQLGLIDGVWE